MPSSSTLKLLVDTTHKFDNIVLTYLSHVPKHPERGVFGVYYSSKKVDDITRYNIVIASLKSFGMW